MSIKIIVKNNTARVEGETDFSVLSKLDRELSYRLIGFEFTQAFKNKRWNGYNHLLTNNLEFPAGLTQRVIEFFSNYGKDVEVINTNIYNEPKPIDIVDRLKELNIDPRYYQVSAMEKAIEAKRGIIKIATGGGKTLVAALIVSKLGGNCVIYVIGKDLLRQFHDFFELIFQQEIGMVGDGICNIKPITIASIWTVGQVFGIKQIFDEDFEKEKTIREEYHNDIKDMVTWAGVSIMDEVHTGAAATMQKIGRALRSEYTIGMSASPYRSDGADMLIEAIFGKIIINISASELIEKGYLVQPHIHFIPVPRRTGMGKTYKEIYKNFIVNNEMRNNLIVKAAKKLLEQDFKTMILYKEIEHGKILYNKLLDDNVNCRILNGRMNSEIRRATVEEFINDECNLILASSIFDIGIDIPMLSGLVLAGSGKSQIRAIQRCGRAIRPYKNKDMAAIIDFNDNCKYLRDHSKERRSIYETEDGFVVRWK